MVLLLGFRNYKQSFDGKILLSANELTLSLSAVAFCRGTAPCSPPIVFAPSSSPLPYTVFASTLLEFDPTKPCPPPNEIMPRGELEGSNPIGCEHGGYLVETCFLVETFGTL